MATRPGDLLSRTALRDWRERHDVSYRELAERAGLSERTVLRAATGKAVSVIAAAALERVTGLPEGTFRVGGS